jgi:hypothetical protein
MVCPASSASGVMSSATNGSAIEAATPTAIRSRSKPGRVGVAKIRFERRQEPLLVLHYDQIQNRGT